MKKMQYCRRTILRRAIPVSVLLVGLVATGFSAQPQKSKSGDLDTATVMKMRRAFENMDDDGDGKVALSEIPENRREMFKKRDANGDGVLTTKEINAGIEPRIARSGGERSRPGGARGGSSSAKITGPSVTKGQPAGIEVGQYAPDFTLEPVQIYPDFKQWLGAKAPKTFNDKILLSDLVGKKEVMLIFGSYT